MPIKDVDNNGMTDDAIKQLAIDIVDGKVFTSSHIPNYEDISMVFMPLAFLDEKQKKDLLTKDPAFIYEYMSESCKMSVNGMPTFMSFRFLNSKDLKKLNEFSKEYQELKDKFMEKKPKVRRANAKHR